MRVGANGERDQRGGERERGGERDFEQAQLAVEGAAIKLARGACVERERERERTPRTGSPEA